MSDTFPKDGMNPDLRIGEIVDAPKWKIADRKEHMYALLKFCATRGVIVTIEEKERSIEMQLESVIYREGLNKRVFEDSSVSARVR